MGTKKREINMATDRGKAEKALIESSLSYFDIYGETWSCISEDWDFLSAVKRVENIARRIGDSEGDPFWVATDRTGKSRMRETSFGAAVRRCVETDLVVLAGDVPYVRTHPYVGLFVRKATELEMGEFAACRPATDYETASYADALNRFVEALRREQQDEEFKKRVKNHARAANKNYASLIKLIDALQEVYARLLIIRIDLGYSVEAGKTVTFGEAASHRNQLFRVKKRTKMFEHLVGSAWKLEYGPYKRFHFHVILFFDGAAVREDVSIAWIVGEEWRNNITEGRGIYYNCNSHKGDYKKCGIGMVHYSDRDAYEGLRMAATYMAKTDYFTRAELPPGYRVFGRSGLPRRESSRGRPREYYFPGVDELEEERL